MKKIFKLFLFALIAGLSLTSCHNEDEPPQFQTEAKQKEILATYVNNVVIPTYKSLADEALLLSKTCTQLQKTPSQELVDKACKQWIEARKYWEQSEAFLFGAAADYNIDPHIDSWPLQKSQLDNVLSNTKLMAELSEEGSGAAGFQTLGYGLLGFHAVEYVLFRDGKPRKINEITENELIFNTAVAEDLAAQTARLEASWAGIDNVTPEKKKMLEDAELEPSMNYGENLINAGTSGNVLYKTQTDAIVQILQGASDISDEVGNTKITDPVNSGNVLDVESWYSWNSIADFTDNLHSVRNAYFGSLDGKVAAASLSAYIKEKSPELNAKIMAAIDHAIQEVSGMPAPFRNHLTKAETKAAIEACNELMEQIDACITFVNSNGKDNH